jgi:SAM-dependent methyltransferase
MDGLIIAPEREPSRIFDRISVLSDPIRCRILLLLEGQELAVSEICQVLQIPQSTISRHLKTLVDDGWIRGRREGTSRQYSATPEPEDVSAQRLWQLVREEISGSAGALQDRTRLAGILSERRTRSQEFFSTAAGEWAELRLDLFGERFDLQGLLGLLDEDWTVGDLGCGTGQTTQSLAPFVAGIVAIDESDAMLAAARKRLAGTHNVDLRLGRLEDLPIDDNTLDAAISVMVLHHVTDPAQVLVEASRALKTSGKLLVVDMLPHERQEFRQQMGHVWLGFDESQIQHWLERAGFHRIRFYELRADPKALGPSLFAATARVAS